MCIRDRANAEELDKFSELIAQKNRQIEKLSEQKGRLEKELVAEKEEARVRFKNLQNEIMKQEMEAQKNLEERNQKYSKQNKEGIEKLK